MRPPALPAAALCHERVSSSRRDHVPATLFSHFNSSCRLHSRLKNRQEGSRAQNARVCMLLCHKVWALLCHKTLCRTLPRQHNMLSNMT
jgi:hypothetical protein